MSTFPTIMPGGEPLFRRGGATGCLCIHGFTASPAEVRWLGLHLAEQGHTVYAPRLPGHAADPVDMDRMRWQDWYRAVEDGYQVLRAQCDEVVVVGHSMGGLLALLLGIQQPVKGVVAMAAPIIFHSRLMARARWVRLVMPYTDQTDRSSLNDIIRAEQANRGEPTIGRTRYDRWSTQAVGELYTLSEVTRPRLSELKAPLLLLYSEGDKTVPLENRDIIAQGVSSAILEQHTFQHSDHILPQDIEREAVFNQVNAFIRRLGSSTN